MWRYSLANWSLACELVQAFDWDSILTDNIDLSWESWHHQFMNIYNEANNTQQAAVLERKPPLAEWIHYTVYKKEELAL